MDLILKNIGEMVTNAGHGFEPVRGKALQEIGLQHHWAVAIKDGCIAQVGPEEEILILQTNQTEVIDLEGMLLLPGFVDPHTHLVYAGNRAHEWTLKQQGVPYLEILRQGGGILDSVKKTRSAGKETLKCETKKRLQSMLQNGITTVEIKSGYGLDTETELLQLEVIGELQDEQPLSLVATFMGAHATPPEYHHNPQAYVDLVIDEMIPAVAMQGIAKFCDVFCETGVFTPEQSRMILEQGNAYGLIPKIHADELEVSGGSQIAAEVNAISADHLLETDDEHMIKMAEAGVIGVCLPATSFNLAKGKYARARAMLDHGMAIALSTDANPGSSPTENMQFVLSLACLYLKLTPAEAIMAATLNAAHAIGLGREIGSIEAGKYADFVVMDAPSIDYLPYHFAMNHVAGVYKKGKRIW
jgi:imidazolonepropionase